MDSVHSTCTNPQGKALKTTADAQQITFSLKELCLSVNDVKGGTQCATVCNIWCRQREKKEHQKTIFCHHVKAFVSCCCLHHTACCRALTFRMAHCFRKGSWWVVKTWRVPKWIASAKCQRSMSVYSLVVIVLSPCLKEHKKNIHYTLTVRQVLEWTTFQILGSSVCESNPWDTKCKHLALKNATDCASACQMEA